MTLHDDIETLKSTYDIATLFRVMPWVFIMRDTRDTNNLVKRALDDVRNVIEAQPADGQAKRGRVALMRILATNFFLTLGVQPDQGLLELLLQQVEAHVNAALKADYDDGLTGESA